MTEIRRRVHKTQGAMGGKLAAYHCKFCGQYHIGHPSVNVAQSIDERRSEHLKPMG